MQAVRQHSYGGPEVLVLEDVPDPVPAAGELLVRVSAAGVNYADTMLRAHEPDERFRPPGGFPVTPGIEIAGTVLSEDSALTGRRIVSFIPAGGYAELAVVPAAAAIPIPDDLDDHTALALFAQGATAVGVIDAAELTAEDTVLVEAAAGGIGTLLVQLAKRAGATVIAAASNASKLDLARSLGADQVVDYSREGWTEGVGPVTVVLDSVGGRTGAEAYKLLSPLGRMVLYGYAAGEPTAITTTDIFTVGAAVIPLSLTYDPRMLPDYTVRAFELAAELKPVIGDVLPLADAAKAHRALAERTSVGKIVLVP
jgi:NADPH2:quinone reductase